MKKYFSLASALMLALSMGMTSCSNDLDEVQAPAEQQPETHILYLNASAPNAETRAAVSGVSGSDAIKITGWKDGDVLKGWWAKSVREPGQFTPTVTYGSVTFAFDEATSTFKSTPTTYTAEDIVFITHGMDGGSPSSWERSYYYYKFSNSPTTLTSDFSNIPLWGRANVSGGNLTANMQLPDNFALVCVHNESGASINIKVNVNGYDTGYLKDFGINGEYRSSTDPKTDPTAGTFKTFCDNLCTVDDALSVPIANQEKVYLPIRVDKPLYVYVNNSTTPFKQAAINTLTAGKVYKATYTGQ